jgi:hypothetical protein
MKKIVFTSMLLSLCVVSVFALGEFFGYSNETFSPERYANYQQCNAKTKDNAVNRINNLRDPQSKIVDFGKFEKIMHDQKSMQLKCEIHHKVTPIANAGAAGLIAGGAIAGFTAMTIGLPMTTGLACAAGGVGLGLMVGVAANAADHVAINSPYNINASQYNITPIVNFSSEL